MSRWKISWGVSYLGFGQFVSTMSGHKIGLNWKILKLFFAENVCS